MTNDYQKLDIRVQKWVFKQGWPTLREIQDLSIDPIMAGNTDVLISASTAAGKTEAFFLPACSVIADQDEGVGILYISPLKALINDQDRRLESLADILEMQVTPWHGDSNIAKKKKLRKNPSGIILITPESLESMLIRDANWVRGAFSNLKYVVIDEFHAFIGSERGHQLLSLLSRLEHLLGRLKDPIPRVALSATLGELETVPLSLRPNKSFPCKIIISSKTQSAVKVMVKGYVDPLLLQASDTREDAEYRICEDLFSLCRGSSHLVFANSRKRTESIAFRLRDFCEKKVLPNEFYPHHGSLAKELREDLESRLQKEQLPTTAVCTMTLELGIDIGKVDSVIQVTAPHSISSLRQRMGRSGRRGGPSILRMLIAEKEIGKNSNIADKLRLQLIQSLAMVKLLISSKWFEPADKSCFHFSTLLHQILAVIAQWGGIRADQLYKLLCNEGPFQNVTLTDFKAILIHMGQGELITQLGSGELVLGIQGEKLSNHYTFYAVFKTPEEFRIIFGSKTLGTLPVDSMLIEGQQIIFGGQRWNVKEVNTENKTIYVEQAQGGKPPNFAGGGMSIHDMVRREMFKILKEGDYRISIGNHKVDFIDKEAKVLFQEGVKTFNDNNLAEDKVVSSNGHICIFTWKGDKVVNTLVALLNQKNFTAGSFAGVIEISKSSLGDVINTLNQLKNSTLPSAYELAKLVPEKRIEKYDDQLPDDILSIGFGAKVFDINGARAWLDTFN
jgi:ATP-dependent Lhr-like helicase